MEFLITCFNFLVMVVTLAYSFYYLLCFDQILFVRDGKRKESPNQEQIYRIRLVPLQNLQHLQPTRREKLAIAYLAQRILLAEIEARRR